MGHAKILLIWPQAFFGRLEAQAPKASKIIGLHSQGNKESYPQELGMTFQIPVVSRKLVGLGQRPHQMQAEEGIISKIIIIFNVSSFMW